MRQSALAQAKNAFELLSRLPQHGLGSKLSRTGWTDDCYWTVQKVRMSPDGKHGSAWGVLTWRGQAQQADKPASINGPLKPVWRVVQDSQQGWQPSGLAAALKQDRQAAKAAAKAEQPAAEAADVAAEQPAA
ncbi:hypothetical protein C2E21_0913 [Chlorella sorokiniana]|uniref:Uncharacterized protein n=1 Tax=Chlorella sorokiniana TaxID=3076 RepID=A0A2P6U376_CHLSO|nr:hypothetical protein C2E21_0913 [Chlorella sorokiniana]|eukprot:PRW60764.1 hypothetical protein C2E21_0913 [Chlorella sorokiniana]